MQFHISIYHQHLAMDKNLDSNRNSQKSPDMHGQMCHLLEEDCPPNTNIETIQLVYIIIDSTQSADHK